MSRRTTRSPHKKPRRLGIEGHLEELRALGAIPNLDDLAGVLEWTAQLRHRCGLCDDPKIGLTRRQVTALEAVQDRALSIARDEDLARDVAPLIAAARDAGLRGELARAVLQRMVAVPTIAGRAWRALGELAQTEQRWPEARAAFAHAWAGADGDRELGCQLAWAQIKCGDLAAAQALLETIGGGRGGEDATVQELLRIARSASARV